MENNKLRISVIIPTYNSADLLPRCLNALEHNNFKVSDFEVLVIDDGSTDDTKLVIDKYNCNSKMNISYFFQKNMGPGIARNKGINHAKSDIIAYTDADCIVAKNWLKTIFEVLHGSKKKVISGRIHSPEYLVFPWKVAPVGHYKVTANLALNGCLSTKLLFDNTYVGLVGEDTDYANNLIAVGYEFQIIDKMLVEHPPNKLTLKQIKSRAIARRNEVKLLKRYGSSELDTIHPIFRPIILKRFSYFSLSTVLFFSYVVSLLVAKAFLLLITSLLVFSGVFIFFGYKRFVTNNEDDYRLSFVQRFRTLGTLLWYGPWFVIGRVRGSIENRYIVI